MEGSTAACWMLIIVSIGSVTGKPVSTIRTQKRQSDQRVAELETLLALQKYGVHHFLRAQSQDGGGGSFSPGYGIIDFNKIGRKKKAAPPSPEVKDWVLSPLRSSSARVSSNNPSNEMSISPRVTSRNKWYQPSSLESASSDDTDTLETGMEN